jgi:DNA-binding MarR family transcriptional regulator
MKRPPHVSAVKARDVALVREFNRFYTKQIGVLQDRLLESSYSLTEVRLLYELSHRPNCTAAELADILGINRGYLSRMLRRLEGLKLVEKTLSSTDKRQSLLTLTAKGRREYRPIDRRADDDVGRLLEGLSKDEISVLLESMRAIRELMSRSDR